MFIHQQKSTFERPRLMRMTRHFHGQRFYSACMVPFSWGIERKVHHPNSKQGETEKKVRNEWESWVSYGAVKWLCCFYTILWIKFDPIVSVHWISMYTFQSIVHRQSFLIFSRLFAAIKIIHGKPSMKCFRSIFVVFYQLIWNFWHCFIVGRCRKCHFK